MDFYNNALLELSFRAFLNIRMLLVESKNAKHLCICIFNIVIAALNRRADGVTTYIKNVLRLPIILKCLSKTLKLTSTIYLRPIAKYPNV